MVWMAGAAKNRDEMKVLTYKTLFPTKPACSERSVVAYASIVTAHPCVIENDTAMRRKSFRALFAAEVPGEIDSSTLCIFN
mmetsp:Transcript_37678/g.70462  ORF Transcript_37678/g.70462 Transcript_37678/m.70462 type:complete len:81 (+) Transcript_37678:1158-1400(+)